jgi:hypothetical protein
MRERQYESRFGSFYLVEKVPVNPVLSPDGERVIFMTDTIAICYSKLDDEDVALLKHGSPETVKAWYDKARKDPNGMLSESLRYLELPQDFPLDEVNRAISTTGYLRFMFAKHVPWALEADA